VRRPDPVILLSAAIAFLLILVLCSSCRRSAPAWVALASTGCPNNTTKGLTVISDSEWWIPCRGNGVQHTTDGGAHYLTENAGLPPVIDAVRLEVTSHGMMLVALGPQNEGGGIYKLANGSWQRGNTHTPMGIAEMPGGDILLVSQAIGGRPRAFRDHGGDLQFAAISGDIFAGVGGAGGVDVDHATRRLRISSEGSGVWGSDDEGVTWFQDGAAAGGTTNGPGFGHTSSGKTLYFAQDKILRWRSQNDWEIVAHPSGQEGWKYVDTVNSYCWSIARDGALFIGGDHVTYGIYRVTNDEGLYTPFLEVTPGPPKGVRIYGVAVLPASQRLLVVARDASAWLTAQPVVSGPPLPAKPGPVRVVPYGTD
jgi:hypothetical protein